MSLSCCSCCLIRLRVPPRSVFVRALCLIVCDAYNNWEYATEIFLHAWGIVSLSCSALVFVLARSKATLKAC